MTRVEYPTRLLGRYDVIGPLGSGGQASVVRARDVETETSVALKLVPLEGGDNLADLTLEAGILLACAHPGVVAIRDVADDVASGFLVIVMDLIDGRTLDVAWPDLDEDARNRLVLELLDALAYLHRRGIVHGDLKPSNVLVQVEPDLRLVLVDLGLAVPRFDGDFRGGTPGYLAPEVVSGRVPDARSDLFSIGTTLLQCALGAAEPPRTIPSGVRSGALLDRLLPRLMQRRPDARLRDGAAAVAMARSILDPDGRVTAPDRLPFHGRDAALADVMESVVAEHCVTCVYGPRGSGRRRLVHEAALRLQTSGVRVVDGAGMSLVGLVEAIATRVGDRGGTLIGGGGSSVGLVTSSLVDRLADRAADQGAGAGLVLALHLDDDPDHVQFAARLARRVRAERKDGDGVEDGHAGSLRLLVSGSDEHIELLDPEYSTRLKPLARGTVRNIVAEVLGVDPRLPGVERASALLYERTAGRAASIDRALRAAVGRGDLARDGDDASLSSDAAFAVTETPADLLLGLDPDCVSVLATVAACRHPVRHAAVTAVVEVDRPSVERAVVALEGRGLIARSGDAIRMRGEEARSAALGAVGAAWIARAHGALAGVVDDSAHATLHRALAGEVVDEETTLRWSEWFLGLGDLQAAQALLQASAPGADHGALDLLRSRTLLAAGDTDGALAVLADLDGTSSMAEACALAALVRQARGETEDAERLAEAAVAAAPDSARGFTVRAFVRLGLGRLDEAADDARHAVACATPEERGPALNAQGVTALRQGRLEEAEASLRGAASTFTERADELSASTASTNLAITLLRSARASEAQGLLEAAVGVYGRAGLTNLRARALLNLGVVENALGRATRAAAHHRAARRAGRSAGEETLVAQALANEGIALLDGGRPYAALMPLRAALPLLARLGMRRAETVATAHMARAYARLGRPRRALRLAEGAASVARDLGPQVDAEVELARAESAAPGASRDHAERAARGAGMAGDTGLAMEAAALGDAPVDDVTSELAVRLLGRRSGDLGDVTTARVLRASRRERGDHLVRAWLKAARRAVDADGSRHAVRRLRRAFDLMTELEEPMSSRSSTLYRMSVMGEELRDLAAVAEARLTALERPGGRGDAREMAEILSVLMRMTEVRSMKQLVSRVLEGALRITGAESGVIALARPHGGLSFTAARTAEGKAVKVRPDQLSTSIVMEVVATGRTLVVADAQGDERYSRLLSVTRENLRALAVVPLRAGSQSIGALYLDGGSKPGIFHDRDAPLLEGFANLAAIAINDGAAWSRDRSARRRLGNTLALERASVMKRLTETRRVRGETRLIGTSSAMARLRDLIEKAGRVGYPVLVTGESGVGKEIVTRSVAAASSRASAPFIPVNCGAMPTGLFESECFGYRRGAFTGATVDSPGLFRLSDGGILFLDEIGDLPLDAQAKLLRVLETGRVRPVGGTEEHAVDVRVVSATSRDLPSMVAEGTFREDLLFRLRVIEIPVPSLRERADDVPDLVRAFIRDMGSAAAFSRAAMRLLQAWRWPGNVRELRNEVQRAVLLADEGVEIPASVLSSRVQAGEEATAPRVVGDDGHPLPLKDVEEAAIRFAIARCGGDRKEAARVLGISRSSLYDRLKRMSDD